MDSASTPRVRRPRRPLLVLDHLAPGPPDAYRLELAARGAELVTVRPDLGEPLPDWRDFGGIIATGGPQSAVDHAAHPWLVPEKRIIAEAVAAGLPFWGVCLGAQLLASSLGADVWRGEAPEFGVGAVRVTDAASDDPVFALAPRRVRTFQWHKDTFALPSEARLLATSDAYLNQAFAWGNAYGVQFHLEPSRDVIEYWAARQPGCPPPPISLAPESLRALLGEMAPHFHGAMSLARGLLRRWLDLVERRCPGAGFSPSPG